VAAYTVTDTVPPGTILPEGITGPLPSSTAGHIAAVVLFGTPKEWIINLVDRNAPPIAIGTVYSAKTIELCAPGDPVCSPAGFDRSAHSTYSTNGMTEDAAAFAADALQRA
jgi:cutinase